MTNGAITANQYKGVYLDRASFACPSGNFRGKVSLNNSSTAFCIGYANGVSAGDFNSSNVMTFQEEPPIQMVSLGMSVALTLM